MRGSLCFMIVSAVLWILALVGCGNNPPAAQAAATGGATVSGPPAVVGGTAPTNGKTPEQRPTPTVVSTPDSISVEALLMEYRIKAKQVNKGFQTTVNFKLLPIQFSGGFNEALDLKKAQSLQFRSKHNDDCDKSGFLFNEIDPSGPTYQQIVGLDKKPKDSCNHLLANFTKNMRVVFGQVPLLRNPSIVIPEVIVHMIP